jgi:ABC-type transport system involved in multi-copper enzyme maturation permease subunit
MIWLTWRQFRWQAITSAAVLAVMAIALGITGHGLVSRYDQIGLRTCQATCTSLASTFINELKTSPYSALFFGGLGLMYAVPVLIGIFWGAPLIAREFEHGTHRLAWNQSVSRTRWAAVKLGLVGLAAVATAGLLSLMIGWWASPIDHALNYGIANSGHGYSQLNPLVFAARGVAPLGYAAFAFALGVTAGVLIRRTLPAMAVTLVIFAAVQILMPTFVRPHLIPPVQATAPFNANTASEVVMTQNGNGPTTMMLKGNFSLPGAWILSNQTITRSGRVFDGPPERACTSSSAPIQDCNNWLNTLHLRQLVSYQPASRFWPLQFAETGVYLVLAAGLGALCTWQIRRRV